MNDTRFLALGDSYTIGTGVEPHQRWPQQLRASLRDRGFNVASPRLVAKNGWTSAVLLRKIENLNLEGEFHLITLQIGANDQFDGISPQEYSKNFQALLEKGKSLCGLQPERMVILSIPDWSVTPFASGRDRTQVSAEIDTFNEINHNLTKKSGAHYQDITPLSRRASRDPSLLADDGLHPSGKMYRDWVKTLLPLAMEIISPSPPPSNRG